MSDMSDDEYVYDSDEYDMSDGSEDEAKLDSDSSPRSLTMAMVATAYEQSVNSVADLLGLSHGQAGLLLLSVDFNRDVTNTDWFDEGKADKLKSKAGLVSACAPGTRPTGSAEMECAVCMDDVPISQTAALACEHRFCKTCWADHIDPQDKDSINRGCLQEGCGMHVDLEMARDVLDEAAAAKFHGWILQRFVESPHTKHIKWCPTAGCETAVSNSNPTAFPEVNCAGCGERWCFECQEEPHRPADCEQVRAWKKRSNGSDLTQMWMKANTKACPKCDLTIVKDAGCQHMTCSRCKFQFCWLCCRAYSEHNEETGGFYGCHKFEQRVKSEGKTDAEKDAMRAQRNLRNYNMAVERHLSHKQERESAKTDLLEFVHNNMDTLVRNGLSVGSFLTDAVSTLAQCRRVLAWSYVYKFYKFDTDDMDRELALFEDYQGRLEQLTRQLQDKVATDASEFVPSKRTKKRRLGSGAGSGVTEDYSAKFDKFREQVQRYGAALKRFLSSVLDFEESSKDFSAVEWVKRDVVVETDTRHVWEVEASPNVWTRYSDTLSKEMEAALEAGTTRMDINVRGEPFQVDLMAKVVTSKHSKTTLGIRRVKVKGADWSCVHCSYHNTASAKACAVCEMPKGRS